MASLMKLVIFAGLAQVGLGQQPAYGQCGGIGWTGVATCMSGYCCTYSNDNYSRCTPGPCPDSGGGGGGGNGSGASSLATITPSASTETATFPNPVLWEDLADNEVIRVDDAYYFTASTMHYSPGAPVLRSYDLVNWEYIGHSVPTLSWSSAFDLVGGQRAYVKGIWASTLQYRPSNKKWYWLGCIQSSGKTFIYTASSPSGPWRQASVINTCYYDAGLLIDDDDTMYVAYGNTQLSVAKLSSDGLSEVSKQQVYSSPSSIGTLEGSRFYKKDGYYYIFVTRPANGQYILRSKSPFGSYEIKQLAMNMPSPVSGSGYPHQGSLVDTPDGKWYYMAFIDAYPGGRVPVLAPIAWSNDWPTIQTTNGRWSPTYTYPAAKHTLDLTTGKDTFPGTSLGPAWEWNHNPDPSKYNIFNGLTLSTATVTSDLYAARNTLTKRIYGPVGTGTLELDVANMADGDRAGLALLRDQSAWVGVKRDGPEWSVCYANNMVMNGDWTTRTTGDMVACTAISAGAKIWLRLTADIAPGGSKKARFYYSTDGSGFRQIGGEFGMNTAWQFFMGYRYGIFNYATKGLGGSVQVDSFTSE